jgi:hypothetical protein
MNRDAMNRNAAGRRLAAGLGVVGIGVLLAAGLAGGVRVAPRASELPAWEPDGDALGTILFYDAKGSVITGGDLSAHPLAAYASASDDGRPGDTKAQLRIYTPAKGVLPALWTGDTMTASTDYPNATAPAKIAKLGRPVVTSTGGDFSFADYISELPNTVPDDPAYTDLYEVRLYTAGALQGAGSTYFREDVQVTVTGTDSSGEVTGTWTVLYPAEQASAAPKTPSASAPPPDDGPTGAASFEAPPPPPPAPPTPRHAPAADAPTGAGAPPPVAPAAGVAPVASAPAGPTASPPASATSLAPVLTSGGQLSLANAGTGIAIVSGLALLLAGAGVMALGRRRAPAGPAQGGSQRR